jgi:flagellar FliJ protein
MKKKSERLGRVQRLVTTQEQQYCRAMGNAQRTLEQHQQRLDELKAYREDYAGRRPPGGVVSSAQWADYQHFLQRLDTAVQSQTQVVMDGRQSRDVHRQRWMVKRQKVESLQRIVDRFRDSESRHNERLGQKAQDDLPAMDDPFRRR